MILHIEQWEITPYISSVRAGLRAAQTTQVLTVKVPLRRAEGDQKAPGLDYPRGQVLQRTMSMMRHWDVWKIGISC